LRRPGGEIVQHLFSTQPLKFKTPAKDSGGIGKAHPLAYININYAQEYVYIYIYRERDLFVDVTERKNKVTIRRGVGTREHKSSMWPQQEFDGSF